MPFDLHISRSASLGAMRGNSAAAPKAGFFARMFSTQSGEPASAPLITGTEFHAVMKGGPAERKSDDVYWVRHKDGDPWFVAEWKPEGNVLLSTSYSSHRYPRNFADMFDQGLHLAEYLNARLFEEVDSREITRSNIDTLLDPKGKYVELQVGTWREAIKRMSENANAPLEYPLGPIDMVSEYLVFHVVPELPVADGSVSQSLERALDRVKIEVVQDGAWRAVDTDGNGGLTKVLHRPDGKWQVWPAWGQAPFARIAETTVAAATQIHQMAGGELQFLGRPFDGSLRDELHAKIGGLGVDFYAWTQTLPPPRT